MAERVVALTLTDPPVEATHWTAAMMARKVGISVSSVQRIWRAHGLRPRRVQQFKLSNGLPLKKGRLGTMTTTTSATARPPCSPP